MKKKTWITLIIWIITLLLLVLLIIPTTAIPAVSEVQDYLYTNLPIPPEIVLIALLIIAALPGSYSFVVSVLLLLSFTWPPLWEWASVEKLDIPVPYLIGAIILIIILKSPFARGIAFALFGSALGKMMETSTEWKPGYQESLTAKREPRVPFRSPRAKAMGYEPKREETEKERTPDEIVPSIEEQRIAAIEASIPSEYLERIEANIPDEVAMDEKVDIKKLSKQTKIPQEVLRVIIERKRRRMNEEGKNQNQ